MGIRLRPFFVKILPLAILAGAVGCTHVPARWWLWMPEQRHIPIRTPESLPPAAVPDTPSPATVFSPEPAGELEELSLNDAIHVALGNSEVVRVLAGTAAVSSGQTIYSPAIINTTIDEARARFDPNLSVLNSWNRLENPEAIFDPFSPRGVRIIGSPTETYDLDFSLSKTFLSGGTAELGAREAHTAFGPELFVLDPQDRYAVDLSLTQPLLRGAGLDVNLAPIVIARINTERSIYQFKDSLQELVRGVIEAYWAVVFARADLWARQQQVEQGEFAYDLAQARLRVGLGDAADVAQTRVAVANFRSNAIAAEANLLQREAALRNVLGLPPTVPERLVPVSPPSTVRLAFDWTGLVDLAELNRPDLAELKLILEADEQRLLQARNLALPSVDAVALHRWNGLAGRTPARDEIATRGDAFTDWSVGVNVSVPLGLRQSRAVVRQEELILARDRANLQQGVHRAVHVLAASLRNVDQFYSQYEAFRETREAARTNLEVQLAEFRAGRAIPLNLLQAIADWGNAVSNEAQALAQYNTALANIERETGTILETHGVQFLEAQMAAKGPRWQMECYPAALLPTPNFGRYPVGSEPAENLFELDDLPNLSPADSPRRLTIPPPPGVAPPALERLEDRSPDAFP